MILPDLASPCKEMIYDGLRRFCSSELKLVFTVELGGKLLAWRVNQTSLFLGCFICELLCVG